MLDTAIFQYFLLCILTNISGIFTVKVVISFWIMLDDCFFSAFFKFPYIYIYIYRCVCVCVCVFVCVFVCVCVSLSPPLYININIYMCVCVYVFIYIYIYIYIYMNRDRLLCVLVVLFIKEKKWQCKGCSRQECLNGCETNNFTASSITPIRGLRIFRGNIQQELLFMDVFIYLFCFYFDFVPIFF